MPTPLLIISDAPSSGTGLGRICRDLAVRIATHLPDIYTVATYGYGGVGDRNLPFMQYMIESMHDWFLPTLQEVWDNFAGREKGVVLFLWDASRALWFARPDLGTNPDKGMCQWLKDPPFEKWAYPAQDATGPHNKLSVMTRECLLGFDRVVAYSRWSEDTIRRSIDSHEAERLQLTSIPHGIDTDVFRPRSPSKTVWEGMGFGQILPHEKVICTIGTNQSRKLWDVVFEAVSRVAKDVPLRLFIQTDTLERHWSFPALAYDYQLQKELMLNTKVISDRLLSEIYSASDCCVQPFPEGFGYPIFESLACGTPVIAGSVGGQAEHLTENLIEPIAFHLEGLYNCVRPVYDANRLAYRIRKVLDQRKTGKSLLPSRLDWSHLWPNEWSKWFCHDRIGHPRLLDRETEVFSEVSPNDARIQS